MIESPSAILDLGHKLALAPAVVGAKAATLAAAKKAGLPVVDGFAIPVAVGLETLSAGWRALERGNSGLARSQITSAALGPVIVEEIEANAAGLGDQLVVRSSARVEAGGAWAGAFTSYAELAPGEVVLGIKGCWASVFAPGVLARAEAAGIQPADMGMAVLVQREITADFGGVANVSESGSVTVIASSRPPAAIVSGWERGQVAVVDQDGVQPGGAVAEIGLRRLEAVAGLALATASRIHCHHIEWAEAEGKLWLFQAQPLAPRRAVQAMRVDGTDVSRDPQPSLEELARLVDEEVAGRASSSRQGMTKWEPALFRIVSYRGVRWDGDSAAPGWGAGRIRFIRNADDAAQFRPREVVAAMYPLNNLAPLLWDAAGVATVGGSPGAHLFEVAAWLGLPAVCGVDIEAATGLTLDRLRTSRAFLGAVDGDGGVLSVIRSEE